MPTLPPLPTVNVPQQLLALVAAIIAIALITGFLSGIYHIAEGMRMYGGSRGQKQKREEALDTARDGAIGAGVCFAGGAILTAITLLIRA